MEENISAKITFFVGGFTGGKNLELYTYKKSITQAPTHDANTQRRGVK